MATSKPCARKSRHRRTKHEGEQNKFHIVPASRGGSNDAPNTYLACAQCHEDYHHFTDTAGGQPRTPEEIIVWFVEYYWDNQWEHVRKALHHAAQ